MADAPGVAGAMTDPGPGIVRGRLDGPADAPTTGERVTVLARVGTARVEHILTGRLDEPVEYCADVDEWVAVMGGGATLQLDGASIHLGPGEWLLLPAGTPHRLVDASPGTSWVTVTGPVG